MPGISELTVKIKCDLTEFDKQIDYMERRLKRASWSCRWLKVKRWLKRLIGG